MDGYAVRAADLGAAANRLRCVGEVAAGGMSDREVGAGEAMAIMTGAPLPRGADAVVPVEQRRATDGEHVVLDGPATAGRFIARRGSECRAGQAVLARGVKLEAATLAVAASVGAAVLDVYARPRAALLTTGDEIVPFDRAPGPGQIRNSNSTMLAALLRRLGSEVADHGIVADDHAQIRDAIAGGLRESDVLFITGGMSMGAYDFVPHVLRELNVDLKITKLRIKPGKPFVFGVAPAGKFVFGLPGNPVSGFACTLRLCSRLIARLSGGKAEERWIHAPLSEPLAANGPREFYQPAILQSDGTIKPLAWRSSADVHTLAAADVLLVRPENESAQPAGTLVRLLEIPS
jgi:molybdopterin molybdotransferase